MQLLSLTFLAPREFGEGPPSHDARITWIQQVLKDMLSPLNTDLRFTITPEDECGHILVQTPHLDTFLEMRPSHSTQGYILNVMSLERWPGEAPSPPGYNGVPEAMKLSEDPATASCHNLFESQVRVLYMMAISNRSSFPTPHVMVHASAFDLWQRARQSLTPKPLVTDA